MGGSPDAPPPPERVNAGEATIEHLFGDADWAQGLGVASPEVQQAILDAEATYGPQYVEQQLGLAEGTLFGTGAQRGLLDLYRDAAGTTEAMRAETATSQRTSDIADVEGLGARATEALRASDPDQQRLIEQHRALTNDLFGRAQRVTPQQMRMAQQGSREAYGDRGREMDNVSIFGEALGREEYLRQNRQEALGAGGQLFGMQQATAADPFQAILGRPSGSLPYNQATGQQALGLGQNPTGGTIFDQDAGVNLALQNNANTANYNANIYGAQQARQGAVLGGALGGIGSIFGGIMAGR